MRFVVAVCFFALPLCSSPVAFDQARVLYERTDYAASLRILNSGPAHDAASIALMGRNYFMLGDYGNAIKCFEEAVTLVPRSSEYELWLGRTYGRKAETGGWLSAPSNASKARQHFEKAAALDPHNAEALNDLFDYYLDAPGFLGGGEDKAEAIARRIAGERPAESRYELGRLAERRKQYAAAEAYLREAIQLAPGQVGRVLDLARYLARRKRVEESDACFAQAADMAPRDPGVAFARAKTYIEQRRNPEEARRLLRRYLESSLTPDDPPKSAAEKLLSRAPAE